MNQAVRQSYWQLTALLLTAHFAGWRWGLTGALALNAAQAVHFVAWHRGLAALEAQVRVGYLALMVVGAIIPGGHWLHATMLTGLVARLSVDYCLAARLLVLLPWNRRAPLSATLVRRVLLLPPGPGPIQPRLFGDSSPAVGAAARP